MRRRPLRGAARRVYSKRRVSTAAFSYTPPVPPALPPSKPYPRGIVNLTSTLTPAQPIGPITDNHWLHPLVDGVRCRVGWRSIQNVPGPIDFDLLDECTDNAAQVSKWIGFGIACGRACPGYTLGGDLFLDGSISSNLVNSVSANFVPGDVGKKIYVDRYPDGFATINQWNSATQVRVDLNASGTVSQYPFYILGRTAGQPWRQCVGADPGILPIPWNTFFKSEMLAMVAASGVRYDNADTVRYVVLGVGRTGEAYWVDDMADCDFYDASAAAAGYVAGGGMTAGPVGWLDVMKDVMDTTATNFPLTKFFLTMGKPFPNSRGGDIAITDLVNYGVTTYPGRFGIMFSQLNTRTEKTQENVAPIWNNRLTSPTGAQFLCSSSNICNACRLSKCNGTSLGCDNYGTDPCLSMDDALDVSYDKGEEEAGSRFVETYGGDLALSTGNHQTVISAHRNFLLTFLPE